MFGLKPEKSSVGPQPTASNFLAPQRPIFCSFSVSGPAARTIPLMPNISRFNCCSDMRLFTRLGDIAARRGIWPTYLPTRLS